MSTKNKILLTTKDIPTASKKRERNWNEIKKAGKETKKKPAKRNAFIKKNFPIKLINVPG